MYRHSWLLLVSNGVPSLLVVADVRPCVPLTLLQLWSVRLHFTATRGSRRVTQCTPYLGAIVVSLTIVTKGQRCDLCTPYLGAVVVSLTIVTKGQRCDLCTPYLGAVVVSQTTVT